MEVRVCANQSGEFFTSNSTVFRQRAEMGQSSRWWHQHAVWSSPPLGASLPDPSRRLRHGLGPPSMGEAAGASQGTPQPTAHQHWPRDLRSSVLAMEPGGGEERPGGKRPTDSLLCLPRFILSSRACPRGLPPSSPGARCWDVAGAPCGAVAKSLSRSFLCPVLRQSQAPGGETLRRGQPGLQLT